MAAAEFVRSRPVQILTIVLLVQAAVFYGASRGEAPVSAEPLAGLSRELGDWRMVQEYPLEKEVADVLRADDTVSRAYVHPTAAAPVNLFVAFFRSQRTGQTPHSPKNCLPGSGWVPTESTIVTVDVPNRGQIEANRYVIQKGDAKSLVLYWYQSRDRVVASEYKAKVYSVADAIRYNRSDTSLVRIVVPLNGIKDDEGQKIAVDFVRSLFQPLRKHFPA